MGYLAETSQVLLLIVGLFMILIILLQRGRGGGLAGAFGGMGGQSAFGTRAGDVFTKITCGIAVAWVILAGLSGLWIDRSASAVGDSEYKSESE
ncbi:MAG: preprotein translocase subunit SecG, partial [Planctomycetaceae bacterium]